VAAQRALACGYGDVGKNRALALRGAGARVPITEINPTCALHICTESFPVVPTGSVVDKIVSSLRPQATSTSSRLRT
jgi:S-adenosylhomocysteine hydrolase